ncbi:hypothetical protein HA402_011540 [Bradysia odoriphaga]|nr:hypothetical protein HA402_011540 [Bradysia odoriphaga]
MYKFYGLSKIDPLVENRRFRYNESNVIYSVVLKNSTPLIIPLAEEEHLLHHWSPWKNERRYHIHEGDEEEECDESSSIDEFPDDLFTQEQRLQGAIVLHFIGVIYFFTMTALVIDNYFIPSVLCICQDLNISQDVGAAVFMATATATPELFTNLISTFIADSDLGLGAIVGSMMFNILGVAAVSSLALKEKVKMDWIPILRDCILYSVNVTCLVIITWDGYINWYEALILTLLLIPYFIVMFQSERIIRFLTRIAENMSCCNQDNFDLEKNGKKSVCTTTVKKEVSTISNTILTNKPTEETKVDEATAENERKLADEREAHQLLKRQRFGLYPCPKDAKLRTFFWFYTWPIRLVYFCTLVNVKTHRKWYPYTFIMSIVWIGAITYMLFFMLVVIGGCFLCLKFVYESRKMRVKLHSLHV